MQLRDNNIKVNDKLKSMLENPMDDSHTLVNGNLNISPFIKCK